VYAKKHLLRTHAITAAAIQLGVAAVALELAAIISMPRQAFSLGNLPWMPLVYSCAGGCIAYPLYYWLLKQIRPDQLASVVWGQFFVSFLESVVLLRLSHIPWRFAAGMVIVVASLVVLARSGPENKMLTVRVTPLPR
jgi:drug/metabolite transporter (DMT)-like permease